MRLGAQMPGWCKRPTKTQQFNRPKNRRGFTTPWETNTNWKNADESIEEEGEKRRITEKYLTEIFFNKINYD